MYNAIRDAVMTRLHSQYPEVSIYGEEIQQGFSRPAFFVQLMPETGLVINAAHRYKSLLVDICYFSPEPQKFRGMWAVVAELDSILSLSLPVADRVFKVADPQPEIIDGVLHYQFKLIFIESLEGISVILDAPGETVTIVTDTRQEGMGYTEETIELMRELNVKEEI